MFIPIEEPLQTNPIFSRFIPMKIVFGIKIKEFINSSEVNKNLEALIQKGPNKWIYLNLLKNHILWFIEISYSLVDVDIILWIHGEIGVLEDEEENFFVYDVMGGAEDTEDNNALAQIPFEE
ncbi:hypothetical protein ACJX0J_020498, partial [Zea mays]